MASGLSLEERVTIPSTLVQGSNICLESPAQRLVSRLRESGLELISCPECGSYATREELLVHRPGFGSVRRVLVRCRRSSTSSEGRSCPVMVESEEPAAPGAPLRTGGTTRPRHSGPPRGEKERMMVEERLICACGCGREFRPRRIGQRFASQGCRNRFNSRARREREKQARLGESEPTPAGSPVARNGSNGVNGVHYYSLADLAARLIELTPEQEQAVRELVRAERARRAAGPAARSVEASA